MLGHLGLNVPNLATAKEYYDRLMPVVGFERFFAHEDELAYRPALGKPGTYIFVYPASDDRPYSAESSGLQHLAFMVKTRSDVRAVHEFAEADRASTVLHGPSDWPQYPPPYFATFWLDPFGFKLEAVCHCDRD